MKGLTVSKIGGNIAESPEKLAAFCKQFAASPSPKILVHGGGVLASEIQKKFGIRQCTLYERCVKLGIRPVSNPVVISWPNGKSRSNRTYRGRCRHYGVTYDPKVKREAVVERDNGICQICGKRCDPNDKRWGSFGPNYPTLDHIRPLSKGGTHTWDNVQCACGMCNSNKRDLLYG